jgi:hypothetical protein
MNPTDHMTDEQYGVYIEQLWESLAPLFLKGAAMAYEFQKLGVVDPEFDATGEVLVERMAQLDTTDLGSLFMTAAGRWAELTLKQEDAQ